MQSQTRAPMSGGADIQLETSPSGHVSSEHVLPIQGSDVSALLSSPSAQSLAGAASPIKPTLSTATSLAGPPSNGLALLSFAATHPDLPTLQMKHKHNKSLRTSSLVGKYTLVTDHHVVCPAVPTFLQGVTRPPVLTPVLSSKFIENSSKPYVPRTAEYPVYPKTSNDLPRVNNPAITTSDRARNALAFRASATDPLVIPGSLIEPFNFDSAPSIESRKRINEIALTMYEQTRRLTLRALGLPVWYHHYVQLYKKLPRPLDKRYALYDNITVDTKFSDDAVQDLYYLVVMKRSFPHLTLNLNESRALTAAPLPAAQGFEVPDFLNPWNYIQHQPSTADAGSRHHPDAIPSDTGAGVSFIDGRPTVPETIENFPPNGFNKSSNQKPKTSTGSWLPALNINLDVGPKAAAYSDKLMEEMTALKSFVTSFVTPMVQDVDAIIPIVEYIISIVTRLIVFVRSDAFNRSALLVGLAADFGLFSKTFALRDQVVEVLTHFAACIFQFVVDRSADYQNAKFDRQKKCSDDLQKESHEIFRDLPACQGSQDIDKDSDTLLRAADLFTNLFASKIPDAQGAVVPDNSYHHSFVSKFKKMASGLKTVTDLGRSIEFLTKFLWECCSWAYCKFTGSPLPCDSTRTLIDSASKWITIATACFQANPDLLNDYIHCMKIVAVAEEGDKLLEELSTVAYTRANFTPFYKTHDSLKELAKTAKAMITGTGTRKPAFWLFLQGESGTGKSALSTMIIMDLHRNYMMHEKKMTPEAYVAKYPNQSNVLYERNSDSTGSKFWESYFAQYALSINDLAQHDDKSLVTEQMMEILHMICTSQFPLDMAFARKGMCYFLSQLVVTSMNLIKNPDSALPGRMGMPEMSVRSKEAFARRRSLVVQVKLKQNESAPLGPSLRMPKPADGGSFSRNVYLLTLCDPMTDTPIPGFTDMTYDTFFKLLYSKFTEHQKPQNNLDDWIKANPYEFTPEIPNAQGKEDTILGFEEIKKGDLFTNHSLTVFNTVMHSAGTLWEVAKVEPERNLITLISKDEQESIIFYTASEFRKLFVDPLSFVDSDIEKISARMSLLTSDQQQLISAINEENAIARARLAGMRDKMKNEIAEIQEWRANEALKFQKVSTIAKSFTIISTILSSAALLGTAWCALSKLASWWDSPAVEAEGSTQASSEAASKPPKQVIHLPKSAGEKWGPIVRSVPAQGNLTNIIDPLVNAFERNMATITFVNGPKCVHPYTCQAIFICDTIAVVCRHMLYVLTVDDSEALIRIVCNRDKEKKTIQFTLAELKTYGSNELDILFLHFPQDGRLQKFSSILSHAVDEGALAAADKHLTALVTWRDFKPQIQYSSETIDKSPQAIVFNGTVKIDLNHLFRMKMVTQFGDCTAPYFLMNNGVQGKWFGFHSAGQGEFAYATMITKQTLEKAVSFFLNNTPLIDPPAQGFVDTDKTKVSFGGFAFENVSEKWLLNPNPRKTSTQFPEFALNPNVEFVGVVDDTIKKRISTETELEYTSLAGVPNGVPAWNAPTDAPAAQNPIVVDGVTVKPLVKGLLNFGAKPQWIPDELQQSCLNFVGNNFKSLMTNSLDARELTIMEALNGMEGCKSLGRVDLSTSAGCPAIDPTAPLERRVDRRDLVEVRSELYNGVAREVIYPKQKLLDQIDAIIHHYENGKCGILVCEVEKKDEWRPLAKVAIGKTRLFEISPFAFQVVSRMYLGMFSAQVIADKETNGIEIGLDPHSQDAFVMYHADDDQGPGNVEIDDDAKTYDVNLQNPWHELYLGIVNDHYYQAACARRINCPNEPFRHSTAADMVRAGLVLDSSNNIHMIVADELWRVFFGFISGCFDTSLRTSIINHLQTKYCIVYLAKLLVETYKIDPAKAYNLFLTGYPNLDEQVGEYRDPFSLFIMALGASKELEHNLSFLIRPHTCGDDNLTRYHQTMRWFTFYHRKMIAASFGLELTYPTKDESVVAPYHTIPGTASFLKRTFRVVDTNVFWCMQPPVFLDWINRKKKKIPENVAVPEAMNNILAEAFEWGELYFYQVQSRLTAIAFAYNLPRPSLPYSEFFNRKFNLHMTAPLLKSVEELPPAQGKLDKNPEKTTSPPPKRVHLILAELDAYIADEHVKPARTPPRTPGQKRKHSPLPEWTDDESLPDAQGGFTYNPHKKKYVYKAVVDKPKRPSLWVLFLSALLFSLLCFSSLIPPVLPNQVVIYDSNHSYPAAQAGKEEGPQQDDDVETTGIKEVQVLTTTSDVVSLDKGPEYTGKASIHGDVNPYADIGLTKIMTRKFMVGRYTWSSADVQGTLIATLNFPYALFNVSTNLVDKMKQNAFLRACVSVEFRIMGTPFHYGALIVGHIPFGQNIVNWKTDNIFSLSTCDAVIVSAKADATTQCNLPFVFPYHWWTHEMTGNLNYFGKVVIRVLHPLKRASVLETQSLELSVWANFENVDIAGPTLSSFSPTETPEDREVFPEFQMKKGPPMKKEQEQRSTGLLTQGIDAVNGVASFASKIGIPYANSVNAGLTAVRTFTNLLGLSKPLNVATPQPVIQETFNQMASGKGCLYSKTLTLDPSTMVSNMPEKFSATEQNTSFAKLAALPGLFASGSFNSTSAYGSIIDKHRVTPMTSYTAGGPGLQFGSVLIPCANVARNFRFWRGTMKYMIYISCSDFHAGIIRISWHPHFNEIPANFTVNDGDYISETVEFRGDTIIEFSVPYMQHRIYSECEDCGTKTALGTNGGIAYSIVSKVATAQSTADSTVYYSIYCAMDSETAQFFVPMGRVDSGASVRAYVDDIGTMLTSNPIVAQGDGISPTMHLKEMFAKPFASLIPAKAVKISGLCDDEVFDVLTLGKRFEKCETTITLNAATYYNNYDGAPNTTSDTYYNWLRRTFMFYSGSSDYKIFANQYLTIGNTFYLKAAVSHRVAGVVIDPGTTTFNRNGTTMEDMAQKGCMELHVPYMESLPFWSLHFPSTWYRETGFCLWQWTYTSTTPTRTVEMWRAIGDDFAVGWPVGAPILIYGWTPPSPETESKPPSSKRLIEMK
jgi:hypothetical protein